MEDTKHGLTFEEQWKFLVDSLKATLEMRNKEIKGVSELLAIMHGDGGHHQQAVGTEQAIKDAIKLLHTKWVTNGMLTDINAALKEIAELKEQVDKKEHTPERDGWRCYFIEHKETREWWAGLDEAEKSVWTKDPMRAYPFDYQYEAEVRAWTYKLRDITEITEHIFLNQQKP